MKACFFSASSFAFVGARLFADAVLMVIINVSMEFEKLMKLA